MSQIEAALTHQQSIVNSKLSICYSTGRSPSILTRDPKPAQVPLEYL